MAGCLKKKETMSLYFIFSVSRTDDTVYAEAKKQNKSELAPTFFLCIVLVVTK